MLSVPPTSPPPHSQAYQVLHKQGVPNDHIVVMVCDDIASDFMNPHPGKLFNQPGGPDVYAGMPKVGAPLRMVF